MPAVAKMLSRWFSGAPEAAPSLALRGALAELLAPLPGDAAGTDVGYEDEYTAIQDEMAKRGGIDDLRIAANATVLLRERGKDLRPVVFMAFAALRTEGLPGCNEVLKLLLALMLRYGDQLHPRKPAARRAGLQWLATDRFADPLDAAAQDADDTALRCLHALAQALGHAAQAWPPDARPDLGSLQRRTQRYLDQHAAHALRRAPAPAAPVPPPVADAAPEPATTEEAWAAIRRAGTVLRADPLAAAAGRAVQRGARWQSLAAAPPAEAGRTRLPPPRRETVQSLDALFRQAEWQGLIDACAQAFNEGHNHLWLDLAHRSAQAHAQLGVEHELPRLELELQVRMLHRRLPALAGLAFDDGTPFASEPTRRWIDALAAGAAPAPAKPGAARPPRVADVRTLIDRARAALRTGSLQEALAGLQAQARQAGSLRERFVLHRAMAELAQERGQAELAWGVLADLAVQIDTHRLGQWEPELAFDTLHALHRLALRGSDATARGRAQDLHARLCAIDPVRAAAISHPA
ncbi:type VI secretion system protein TssA [Aquincola sp. MAHUQ-54]|uniref:Type VI secretion system protein TssA n=1 Tax=Aquincola agrisoli TaxID=3119538 RepID=A0AAW9QE23_9BURK